MIRSPYLTRAQWEAKFRRWGCQPLPGKGPLNTAEWWQAKNGMPFTVPIEEPDGRCSIWAVQKLCQLHGHPPSAATDNDTTH